jgi:DnaK suppressor protein
MQDTQLEQFRCMLLELKSELETMAEGSMQDTRPVELDQARIGRLSRLNALQAQEMAQETARRRQRHLVEIEGALRRIDTGEYGCCFVCGEAIDVRRLAADPSTTRCIRCAENR